MEIRKFLGMSGEDETWLIVLQISFLLSCVLSCRFIYLIIKVLSDSNMRIQFKHSKYKTLKTMIVIGSGGHTMEMLSLMKDMNPNNYSPRIYVMADSDTTSEPKILSTEELLTKKASSKAVCMFSIFKFPRSRHVGQSYVTSIWSTVLSTIKCVPFMLRERPELVLCNGPGTCVPICFLAFLMRVLFLWDSRIIFVESVCRVKSLSLTGKILYCFADLLIVQWPDLTRKYKRVVYIGRL